MPSGNVLIYTQPGIDVAVVPIFLTDTCAYLCLQYQLEVDSVTTCVVVSVSVAGTTLELSNQRCTVPIETQSFTLFMALLQTQLVMCPSAANIKLAFERMDKLGTGAFARDHREFSTYLQTPIA